MERRKFLIGMGTAAAGSAALVGTGAFDSVTAERPTQVAVSDDANGLLRLEGAGTPGSERYVRSDGNGGQLELDLDGNRFDFNGVNPNAVTEFDQLFVIQNQGTQTVDVDIEKRGINHAGWGHSDTHHVEFYASDTNGSEPSDLYDPGDPNVERLDNDSATSGNSVALDVGDTVIVSLKVDTTSYNLGDALNDRIVNKIRINADAGSSTEGSESTTTAE